MRSSTRSAFARWRAGRQVLPRAQRLGIAAALLGDPATVALDEPVNGLDVEGIRWMRGMLGELAGHGRTVFFSSHLMGEVAQTATRLIVIGKGAADRGDQRGRFHRLGRARLGAGAQLGPAEAGRAAAGAGRDGQLRW